MSALGWRSGGVGARVGKLGKSGISHGKGEGHVVHTVVCNVCPLLWVCGQWQFARAAF